MYLSRIALESGTVDAMRFLASPHLLHGAVESCFIGERKRNLWRVDYLRGEPYLLIVSVEMPNFEQFAKRHGRADSTPVWDAKPYDTFLERITQGQPWQFRLRANPVRSSINERTDVKERGKVFNHVTPDQQKDWLIKRCEANGFLLDKEAFEIVQTQWYKFRKETGKPNDVTLLAVTFEGVLTVTDAVLFRTALTSGIGRGKAYGCGLLTVANPGRG